MATQLERPRFFEQQYLGADDLTALVEYDRIARARHDLGAHSWGIAMGLHLAEKPAQGGVDVYIQPGYAWDGFGRPIVLTAPYKIPAELFKSLAYDAGIDNTGTPGRTVDVWLEYVESPVGGPANGFAVCTTDEQYSRVVESYRVVIGERPAHADRHDPVNVGGKITDAETAVQAWGVAADPLVTDESIPYQTFSEDVGEPLWLIPLGVVRWLPNTDPNTAGTFQARTAADTEISDRKRIYTGVIGETINASRGFIRLRRRSDAFAPKVWSNDLVWCEGNLRVSGDTKLLAGKLAFLDENNGDKGTPLTISRLETNAIPAPDTGRDLVAQIGKTDTGSNRFVVGPIPDAATKPTEVLVVRDNGTVGVGSSQPKKPLSIRGKGATEDLVGFEAADGTEKWYISQKVNDQPGLNIGETGGADGRLYIKSGGDVGINTTTPSNRLHVNGNTGIRQNRLYLSGGEGGDNWSSISYNAHRDVTNSGWTFPDPTRKAVSIDMDDSGGTPRFSLRSTRNGSPTGWTERLRVNGETGDTYLAHNGGNVGVGTSAPTHKVHVNSNLGLRQNHLYLSGGDMDGDRWCSVSYNAHHNDANSAWTFPDPSRAAVTIEMDDRNGTPRFSVFSTTSTSRTNWVQRFTVNGDTGNVGIGTNPGCRFHVVDAKSGNAGETAEHIALIDNTSAGDSADVLALRVARTNPSSGCNFLTFFGGATPVGAIEGNGAGGIQFTSGAADYAEWIPRLDPAESFEPGDIVGITKGHVTHRVTDADHVLVISTAPIILGNRPAATNTAPHEGVAMLGQVPVKIRGAVKAGDIIIASEEENGIGVAISPEEMTIADYARAVGTAWESDVSSKVRRIRVAIGLPMNRIWAALAAEIGRSRKTVK